MATEYRDDSKKILKYNPQIDGLRFCAVLFVICYHWLPSISDIKASYFFGGMVNFFFVLSSYLITTILFNAKEKSVKMNYPRFKVILIFLLRRTVRIFPAYYIFLLVLIFLPTIGSEVRNNAGMYFSYLSNFWLFKSQVFYPVTAHLWTLAVEEQFYLLWPFLIIFIPQKHLLKTFLIIIIGSVISRAVSYHATTGVPQDILTQYCVDAFAVGGLLAYKYRIPETEKQTINKYFNIILYTLLPFGVIIIFTRSYYFSFVVNKLLFSMISLKVIEGAVTGYKNFAGKFLQNKGFVYLGKISYAIYLYHLAVPLIFWKLYGMGYSFLESHYTSFFDKNQKGILIFQNILASEPVYFIVYAIITVTIASLSWKLIERPIMKLKVSYDFNNKKPVLNTLKETVA